MLPIYLPASTGMPRGVGDVAYYYTCSERRCGMITKARSERARVTELGAWHAAHVTLPTKSHLAVGTSEHGERILDEQRYY